MNRRVLFLWNITCLLLIVSIISCSGIKKEKTGSGSEAVLDSTSLINNFIYGLWSVADKKMLNNDGYFFQPDGIVRLVASEFSGTWKLIGRDSLKLRFQFYSLDSEEYSFKIDSLSMDRMVLRDSQVSTLYRKVPFGVNNEGTVLQGFMASLQPGQIREHVFEIISAKELKIELTSDIPSIGFRLYEADHEVTLMALKHWTGILTHGGKYRILVSDSIPKNAGIDLSYSLKVIGY